MTKLRLEDSIQDMLIKLAGGNPGAFTVCLDILRHGAQIDPDCAHPMLHVLDFDDMGLYGSEIWMLYEDVCGTDLVKLLGVLRGKQLGYIRTGDILRAVREGQSLDIDDIVERVCKELPSFNADWQPQTEVQA